MPLGVLFSLQLWEIGLGWEQWLEGHARASILDPFPVETEQILTSHLSITVSTSALLDADSVDTEYLSLRNLRFWLLRECQSCCSQHICLCIQNCGHENGVVSSRRRLLTLTPMERRGQIPSKSYFLLCALQDILWILSTESPPSRSQVGSFHCFPWIKMS